MPGPAGAGGEVELHQTPSRDPGVLHLKGGREGGGKGAERKGVEKKGKRRKLRGGQGKGRRGGREGRKGRELPHVKVHRNTASNAKIQQLRDVEQTTKSQLLQLLISYD